jgi:Methyltransferase FkbM domain
MKAASRNNSPSATYCTTLRYSVVPFVLVLTAILLVALGHLSGSSAARFETPRSRATATEESSSDAGCRHYYIDLGTNNANSIVDFINGTVKSAHKEVRPIIEYRDAHSLSTRDFCVFGFEPNPIHNKAHADVISKWKSHVKELTIFSETIAGSADGKTSLLLDQSDGGGGRFPAWGSSVMKNHVAMNRQNNTQRIAVRSMDFSTWLTNTLQARSDESGHVLIRMDIEGSEFAILRDLVDDGILCRSVNKLVIEWHAKHFQPQPYCVQAMYEWMLSNPKCSVQMESTYQAPPIRADCNGWLLTDQLTVD